MLPVTLACKQNGCNADNDDLPRTSLLLHQFRITRLSGLVEKWLQRGPYSLNSTL